MKVLNFVGGITLLLAVAIVLWINTPLGQRALKTIDYDLTYTCNQTSSTVPGTPSIALPAVCAKKEISPGTTITITDVEVRQVGIPSYTFKRKRFYFITR